MPSRRCFAVVASLFVALVVMGLVSRRGSVLALVAVVIIMSPFAMPEGVTWTEQVVNQLTSIGITAVFAPVATIVILLGMRLVMGDLRVDEESESEGLDLSQHSESAYTHD